MSTRSEKERFKGTQEKAQAILSALLKDDDNKYCVDCDAKGPRWASWNLGIFLCIRCAGIHRNLGVHISRVKSVNLDTWTPEQISMMMEIGNSRARAVYEANIPDNFRRPQIDSPLESFIRAKYEHKKYIAREWIPPTPKVPKELENVFIEDDTRDKKRPKPKSGMVQLNAAPKSKSSPSASNGSVKKSPESSKPTQPETVTSAQQKKSSASLDLLGLDTPTQNTSNSDLLGDLLGGPPPVQPSSAPNNTNPAQQTTPPGQTTPKQPQQTTNGTSTGEESLMSETQSKSTKESILALYGSGNSQQQQFGVPGGVYMPQQASPQQMGMYGGMPVMGMGQQPGMMGQQPNMMGQQPHMMGHQPHMMGQNPNLMGQQPNMMGQQPNMMGQQPNMMGQQPNMMGQQPGMMGQQQGMMAMQPTPEQLYMYHQQMSGQYYEYMPYEQQPNMYGMGMMGGGGAMMMQPGATPNQMGNNVGVYNQPQMQQYQQMQQQVSAMKIGNSTGLGMGGQSNWGAPSTLSNNLWQ